MYYIYAISSLVGSKRIHGPTKYSTLMYRMNQILTGMSNELCAKETVALKTLILSQSDKQERRNIHCHSILSSLSIQLYPQTKISTLCLIVFTMVSINFSIQQNMIKEEEFLQHSLRLT